MDKDMDTLSGEGAAGGFPYSSARWCAVVGVQRWEGGTGARGTGSVTAPAQPTCARSSTRSRGSTRESPCARGGGGGGVGKGGGGVEDGAGGAMFGLLASPAGEGTGSVTGQHL
jgi:hypothetical protein